MLYLLQKKSAVAIVILILIVVAIVIPAVGKEDAAKPEPQPQREIDYEAFRRDFRELHLSRECEADGLLEVVFDVEIFEKYKQNLSDKAVFEKQRQIADEFPNSDEYGRLADKCSD